MKTASARHVAKPMGWVRHTCLKCGFSWIRRDWAFQKATMHTQNACGGALRTARVPKPRTVDTRSVAHSEGAAIGR